MFHVALYEPEIPPNTGNVIRLCANTGATLHLIHPLGFSLDDKRLRRAGLDYHEWATVQQHANLAACLAQLGSPRCFGLSTKGRRSVFETRFRPGDLFLFGPETRGLPAKVLGDLGDERVLGLPMRAGVRSLNLANTVAVVVYEAWRQHEFDEP